MKELSLKEIQSESLRILQSVHEFCIANDIRYSLAYGTLIGAIRHQGFIPWDDDIDIYIPRPDYERFISSFSAPGLGIISEKDPDCYITYCRVFDTVRTASNNILLPAKNYQGGVSIDVFPIDGVPDDYEEFKSDITRFKRVWILNLRYRHAHSSIGHILKTCSFKDACILLAVKPPFVNRMLLNKVKADLHSNAVRIPYGSTSHWSQIVDLEYGAKEHQLCSDFEYTIDMPFEGHSFKVMNGYDRVLRVCYGDYMQLPPIEQQRPKHRHVKLFWK